MQKPAQLLLLLILSLLFWRCDLAPQGISAKVFVNDWPSQRDLYRTFREQGELTIVYGTADPALAEAYRNWADILAEASRRTTIRVQSDTSMTRQDLSGQVLLVVGTPQQNRVAARISGKLPVGIEKDRLRFDDYTFEDTSTVFSLAFYPSPFNRKMPLLFLTGLSDQAILKLLHQQDNSGWSVFRWANWGYAVYQKGQRVLLGNYEDSTWSPDTGLRFDFTIPPTLFHQSPHYRFWSREKSWSDGALEAFARASEESLQRIEDFTGQRVASPKIDHYLYPSTEEKGLLLNNTDQAHVDPEEESVHTILNDQFQGHYSGKENELLLRRLLGQPRTRLLERGLAIYFTNSWQKRGYRYWAQRLYQADALLPLSTLTDNDSLAANSRLLTGTLSASFVEFLIDSWGKERFLKQYQAWRPTPEQFAALEKQWKNYLAQQPAPEAASPQNSRLPFLRGFNFTHEGYQIYDGYGSGKAGEALRELDAMHVNAASIVPYTGIRDPQRPTFIPISDRPGSENDEVVIHTVHAARKQGMTTMMKPQIWIGGGSWPGDIEMQSDADWKQFFHYYRRWIFHYAMLSEIHNVDILCIGTELSLTTLQRPDDWRRLIRDIRRLYHGRLAYAANWGQEFEQLPFWKDLDIIGINCYYPISDKPAATRKDLQQGFRDIADRIRAVAERENKPLVFTEIGFSSVEAPWILPYSDGYDRPANGEHQRLCYEIVLETISDSPWCDGIFWWKWPTDLEEEDRREGKGFMPNGKPAAKVVADYYGRMKEKAVEPAR